MGAPSGFVYRDGAQLMLDGEQYRFVGSDNIDMLDWNIGGFDGTSTAQQTPAMLDDYFAMMAAGASVQPTVTRTFASEEYGGGNTNTDGFDQLARVVAAAEANGQKLILCLSNGIDNRGLQSELQPCLVSGRLYRHRCRPYVGHHPLWVAHHQLLRLD
jgi:hypothetical protein